MTGPFDDETVDMNCEGCGRKFSETIGWIKANPNFTCDCGARLDSEKFLRGWKGVESEHAALERELDEFEKL